MLVPGVIYPQALQQLTEQRRKDIQRQRLAEYEEAVVLMKAKVKEAEGQAMRETVQDKARPALLVTLLSDALTHDDCSVYYCGST